MAEKNTTKNNAQEQINEEMINSSMGGVETAAVVEGLAKMSKAVQESVVTTSRIEARFLVDTYYQMQHNRIVADNQIRAIVQAADDQGEQIPLALEWVSKNMRNQENQIKKMLLTYAQSTPVGRWAMATKGIGPVLAAGCLSYFDINKVKHYNQFWSYAGLNDVNNPWLGTERANKLVKMIYDELNDGYVKTVKIMTEDDDVADKPYFEEIEYYGDNQIKEQLADLLDEYQPNLMRMGKYLGKMDHYGAGDIFEMMDDEEIMDLKDELMRLFDKDIDRVEDFIIRNYVDKNACTEVVIQRIIQHTGRTRAVVTNGLQNMIKVRKEKKPLTQFTKYDASSYLAKPPYNAAAKQLNFLIGESFVKVANRGSLYGRLYQERKAYEIAKNEKHEYADYAEKCLNDKNWTKGTESYKYYVQGMLPPAQIHRRAKRHAVQIFLSHLFEAMYMDRYKKKMDFEIYPIAYLGHVDYIGPEVPFEEYIKI